jgi:hypothetical protein
MLIRFLLLLVLAALAQASIQARPLDLRADCGAVGDMVADDGPALSRCFDRAARLEGSTIYIPDGRYRIATPVVRNFLNQTSSLTIRGEGSSAQIIPATDSATAITLQNLVSLLIEGVYFFGDATVSNDAFHTLKLESIEQATLRNTHFYGILSLHGGSIVHATNCDLLIERCSFRGCATASAAGAAVVHMDRWAGFVIRDSEVHRLRLDERAVGLADGFADTLVVDQREA